MQKYSSLHFSLIIFAQVRTFYVPKICCFFVMSVNHNIGLSCMQWTASNRQGNLPVSVAWSSCSRMQGLQGKSRGLHCSGQTCCSVPARRAGTAHGEWIWFKW